MLPIFPKFKPIELSDKEDVEKITHKYPPYSDFNFVSMWSWDIKGEMRLSQLNGNLVIRFTDYLTSKPFYSFLGNNEVNKTAEKLLELSKKGGIKPILKLVPEIVIKELDDLIFKKVEDRDNFDYIYDVDLIKNYDGKKLRNKRNQMSYFLKKYPHSETKIIDLKDPVVQDSIVKLFNKWIENKLIEKKFSIIQHKEISVIKTIFSLIDFSNLMSIGVFIDDKLCAFFINELTKSEHAIGLIAKADISMIGIYAFLRRENAKMLSVFNKKYINDEQDLGIENLRQSKTQFRPVSFLKKYQVSYL